MSVYLGNNEVGIGVYEKPPQKPYTGFKFHSMGYANKVKLTSYITSGGTLPTVSLLWSMDNGTTWQNYTNDTWISLGNGERVCFMAGPSGNVRFSNNNRYNKTKWYFTTEQENGSIFLEGNIMSLLTQDYENADEVPSFAFMGLFEQRNYTASANFRIERGGDELKLPAKVVNECGYASMFAAQYNLGTMPDLPAMTVGDGAYESMFNGSGLHGDLSGKCLPCECPDHNAYSNMFASNDMTKAPVVCAPEAGNVCGHIFYGCSSLTEVHLPNMTDFDNDPVQYCENLKFLDIGELNFKPNLKNGYYKGQGVIAANTDFQGVYPSDYMPNGWTYVCKTTGEVLTPPEN